MRLPEWSKQARAWAYDRDRGRCVLCGFDPFRLDWTSTTGCDAGHPALSHLWAEFLEPAVVKAMLAGGFKQWRPLWEADHTVPLVIDPAGHRPGNIRTLCVPCHKGETAKLAERLPELRRNPPTTKPCPACGDQRPLQWSDSGVCVPCAIAVALFGPSGPAHA